MSETLTADAAKMRVATLFDNALEVQRTLGTTRAPGAPMTLVEYASSLQLFLTLGYLTRDQADALIAWFTTQGVTPPPQLPSPDGFTGPSIYDTLTTAIRFAVPPEGGEDDEGVLDFFAGALSAVGDLIDIASHGVSDVLHESTLLLHAGAHLVTTLEGF